VSTRFDSARDTIETALEQICADHLSDLPPSIAQAIEYALRSPGKRLRPLLSICAYRACGGDRDVTRLACAPEIIHSYSLVHDDLPCMDDDDMRRGRPTTHRVHGARTAIIAGASMIPLAVTVASDALSSIEASPVQARRVIGALLSGAGAGGMIGGQLRDLAGEGASLSLTELEEIHSAKTGALIAASARMGAVASGADEGAIAALDQYGRFIGLAFQILDDVLDLTSTTAALGKTARRDEALGKSTYPALLGVDGARSRAEGLVEAALSALSGRDLLTQELREVANFMVTRTS
jgi:geranylgeranyl pyrophosphate synthase